MVYNGNILELAPRRGKIRLILINFVKDILSFLPSFTIFDKFYLSIFQYMVYNTCMHMNVLKDNVYKNDLWKYEFIEINVEIEN